MAAALLLNVAARGESSVVEHPGGTIEFLGFEEARTWERLLTQAGVAAADELPRRLGLPLPSRARVVFCADTPTFARLAGHPRPGHLLGAARPAEGLVALHGPLLGPGPEANAIHTLRHELAHLAIGVAEERSGPVPRWFDEGAASWFAGGFAELGPLDLAPAAARRALSLRRLAHGFPEDLDGRRVAYVKSQLAVELLERERGPGTVAAIGRAMHAGVPFADALARFTGFDESGLDVALERATAPHGLLLAVLRRSLSPVLAMSALVVLGFIVRRVRARRRLKQWEREESARDGEGREGGPGGGHGAGEGAGEDAG